MSTNRVSIIQPTTAAALYSDWTETKRHLSFVVADGGVHLLLVHVLDLGGGAAQDALLLLLGQRLGDHLDGLGPFVPAGQNHRFNYEQAALFFWSTVDSTVG